MWRDLERNYAISQSFEISFRINKDTERQVSWVCRRQNACDNQNWRWKLSLLHFWLEFWRFMIAKSKLNQSRQVRKLWHSKFQPETFNQNSSKARCLVPTYPKEMKLRCMAYMPMYHFDSESKLCKGFIYGGCGGSDNKFQTLQDCVETCDAKNASKLPGEDRWNFRKSFESIRRFHSALSTC